MTPHIDQFLLGIGIYDLIDALIGKRNQQRRPVFIGIRKSKRTLYHHDTRIFIIDGIFTRIFRVCDLSVLKQIKFIHHLF